MDEEFEYQWVPVGRELDSSQALAGAVVGMVDATCEVRLAWSQWLRMVYTADWGHWSRQLRHRPLVDCHMYLMRHNRGMRSVARLLGKVHRIGHLAL